MLGKHSVKRRRFLEAEAQKDASDRLVCIGKGIGGGVHKGFVKIGFRGISRHSGERFSEMRLAHIAGGSHFEDTYVEGVSYIFTHNIYSGKN